MSKINFEMVGRVGGGIVGACFGGPAGAAIGSSVGGVVGGAIDGNSKKDKKTKKAQVPIVQQQAVASNSGTQNGGQQSLINSDSLKLAMSLINQSGGTSNAASAVQVAGSSSSGGSSAAAVSGAVDLASKLFS